MALFMDYHEDLKLPAQALAQIAEDRPPRPGRPVRRAAGRAVPQFRREGVLPARGAGPGRHPAAPRRARRPLRRGASGPGKPRLARTNRTIAAREQANEKPRISPEGLPGRRGAGRRVRPPALGGAASAHGKSATSSACSSCRRHRSDEAAGPAAVPPRHRVAHRVRPRPAAPPCAVAKPGGGGGRDRVERAESGRGAWWRVRPGRDAPSQHAGFRLLPEPSQRDRRPFPLNTRPRCRPLQSPECPRRSPTEPGIAAASAEPLSQSAAQRPRGTRPFIHDLGRWLGSASA